MYRRLFIIVSLSIVVAGCSVRQPANNVLLEAERNVNSKPHHSLELILNLDTTDFEEADRALYELLTVEAVQKSGVVVGNDTLLANCREFFERHGNRNRLTRTLFQLGIAQYASQQYADAINNLKRAEQLAEKDKDYEVRHSVYEALGRINSEADNPELALRYYKLALDAARRTGNSNWQALDMALLATIYGLLGDTKKQNAYVAQCQPLLKHIGKHEKAVVLTSLAGLNLRVGYTLTAKQMLEEANQLEPLAETSNLMGDICAEEGKMGQAVDYWYMALNGLSNHVSADAYKKLINHFENKGDYLRAFDLSKRLNKIYAQTGGYNKPYNLAELQNKFEDDAKSQRFYQRIITLLSAVIALFVIIALLLLYHRVRVRRYRRIIDSLNSSYAADLARYNEMKDEMAALQKEKQADAHRFSQKQREIEQLEQKLSEYQEDKQRPEQWNVENSLLNDSHVAHMHRMAARGMAATTDDWQELSMLMSAFMAKLQQYDLNTKEMGVCTLIKLRFIPSEIATLTSASPQAVTNMRVRLHERLFGCKGGARDFDQKIREM